MRGVPAEGAANGRMNGARGKRQFYTCGEMRTGARGRLPPLNNFFCKETGSPCNRAHVRDVFHCGKFCKRIVAHFVFDVDDIVGDVAAVLVYHARDIE